MSTLESHQESEVAASNKIIEEKLDIKEEEEYQDGDEQEMIANAMSGDKIKQLLSADGPTVKAVLLKCDGSVQEISYDSTPARNHVTEILGAPPSIIGQYPDLDVIVVGPRCQESQSEFELNKHKLRFPFNDATFSGDIFLYRFNQDCVCVDFTANEYKEFASKSHEDVGKVFKPILSDDQDVQDDEDEEYDEEADAQAAEEFMRQVIINKVRQEYPQKFGREPTEQELEDMVNATLSVFASGAMPDFGDEEEDEEEQEEEEDDDDEEYDPNEDKETAMNDEIEDIPNEEDLVNDKQDIEKALNEQNEALKDVLDEEEEKIVNSEHFENELISAIDIVQQMAKVDKEKILSMTMELYKNETGMEPTADMMNQAFELFAKAGNGDNECDGDNEEEENEEQQETEEPETKDEDVEDDIDVETFNKEMEEALKNVRNLGASHQKEFVNQISKTYTELNGNEPTQEQLSQIFGRIKEKLADEARDEFLEENDNNNDDEEDGDDEEYKPNEQDTKQIEEDKKIDVLEELVEQNDNNEQEEEQTVEHKDNDNKNEKVEPQKVKILVTPVKRRPSGSRVDIYLKDQPDTNKTLEFASSKFEQINGRAPNENDTQRLKEFLTTGMLFESQMNTEIPLNDDDDEDDEDYNPDKDTFDYSKDIEDDMECENEVDENDDTSNMVDID